jgi:hypothetical protein
MTSHTASMADRLPLLYREGELVGQLLDLIANQLAILDEEQLAVRRSHAFGQATEFSDAARLGALLDLPAEDWQDLELYRAWVNAIRDATLRDGAVTVAALKDLIQRYAAGFQDAVGLDLVPELLRPPGTGPAPDWDDGTDSAAGGIGSDRLAFIEFPRRRRFGPDQLGTAGGPIEPLTAFTLTNRGLAPAPLAILIGGLATGPEYVPVIANLTTGEALAFTGTIRPGERLWLTADSTGTATIATLEGRDVTQHLRSISELVPGTPWNEADAVQPAAPITLARGDNTLWFLTVAQFDAAGLGRALLSLADTELTQGRFGTAHFNHALFVQAPAVRLEATWVERRPASVDVHLPGGRMLCPAGRTDEGVAQREVLRRSLDEAVSRIRAAGIATTVSLDVFAEGGPQLDRLRLIMPLVVRETGPVGADSMPENSGQFDVTRFDGSKYR